MTSVMTPSRAPSAIVAGLVRDIQMGKLALVEVFEEPDWIQVRPSKGAKRLHTAGVYYFLRMQGDIIPRQAQRRVYSITFLDRLMTFVSNCLDANDSTKLLPPSRANSKLSGAWDTKIAKFLSKYDLLETSRGVGRSWLVNRQAVMEFLRKVNGGEIKW